VPLVVHTAPLGFDDSDILIISKSHNQKVVADGWPGGHRGIGLYFSPDGQLQKLRMQRCGFKLEHETDAQWRKYFDDYVLQMRQSYRKNRQAWDTLLSWGRVVIVSRELEPPRSPRTVLAQFILPKLGASYAGEL